VEITSEACTFPTYNGETCGPMTCTQGYTPNDNTEPWINCRLTDYTERLYMDVCSSISWTMIMPVGSKSMPLFHLYGMAACFSCPSCVWIQPVQNCYMCLTSYFRGTLRPLKESIINMESGALCNKR
jgi:hypothetical protein